MKKLNKGKITLSAILNSWDCPLGFVFFFSNIVGGWIIFVCFVLFVGGGVRGVFSLSIDLSARTSDTETTI